MNRPQSPATANLILAGLLGLCTLGFVPPAHAGTIRIVPQVHHSSVDLPAAILSCDLTPTDPQNPGTFDITLVYDRSRLNPAGVLPPDDNRFTVSFLISLVDSALPGHSAIRMLGVSTAQPRLPVESQFILAQIVFRPVDSARTGETTPLSFYWTDCRSNCMYTADSSAILIAGCTRDPDGFDITSVSTPPPTPTGLCDSCQSHLAHGDTLVQRNLTFESTHLPLDISTAVDPTDPLLLPATAILHPNYPNPFNSGTTIRFTLPCASSWRLDLFDITGRSVRTFSGRSGPGETAFTWDGRNADRSPLPTGIYLCRLTAADYSATRRLLLLR